MGEIKESYDFQRQTLGKILPIDTPLTVILDVSEICNLKCNYCFRSDPNKANWGYADEQGKMDWDTFTLAVSQIKEFPHEVKHISLSHHGEPLTNRSLPDMISYIKMEGISSKISIHTNATLLTNEYAKELAESNIDKVVISIQGLNSDTYNEKCSTKIDFTRFYNTLKYFYEIKRNTQVNIKIANTSLKAGEEEKFYSLFQPISDRVFIEQIIPLWSNVNIKNANNSIQNKYGRSFKKQQCCSLIFYNLIVLPNGDVYPCTQLLAREKLGNIRYAKLVEYWRSPVRKELLRKQLVLEQSDICRDCAILNNSIFSKADMIDDYRDEILKRLSAQEN